MSYTVWIKVENDTYRGSVNHDEAAWWAGPGEFETREEAVEWVEDFVRESNNNDEFERLED